MFLWDFYWATFCFQDLLLNFFLLSVAQELCYFCSSFLMDRLSYIQVGPINVLTPFITGNIVRVPHFLISITFFFIPNLILASPVLESLFQLSCSRCPVLESCSQAYCSRCPVLEFLFHMPHPSCPVPCSQLLCSRITVPDSLFQISCSRNSVGKQCKKCWKTT